MSASPSTAEVTDLGRERSKHSLRETVTSSLQIYLNQLSGHEPTACIKCS